MPDHDKKQRQELHLLRKSEIVCLNGAIAFRVVKGFFAVSPGVVLGPSSNLTNVLAPDWNGAYIGRCAEVTDIPSPSSPGTFSDLCERCGGLCIEANGSICKSVEHLSSLVPSSDDEEFVIVEIFLNNNRPLLRFDSLSEVPSSCEVIRDTSQEWDQQVSNIVIDILSKRNARIHNDIELPIETSVVIIGSKDTGKSTFAQYLLNSLLSIFDRVALLDTDPGQPLFGPPSTVSSYFVSEVTLSPFNLSSKPKHIFMVHVADVTPSYHPRLYLSAVGQCVLAFAQTNVGARRLSTNHQQPLCHVDPPICPVVKKEVCAPAALPSRYRKIPSRILKGDGSDPDQPRRLLSLIGTFLDKQECQLTIPLIVNTPGWTVGLGWQLLSSIFRLTWATLILELKSEEDAKSLKPSDKPYEMLTIPNAFEDLLVQYHGQCHSMEPTIISLKSLAPQYHEGRLASAALRWHRWKSYFQPSLAMSFDEATDLKSFFLKKVFEEGLEDRPRFVGLALINNKKEPRIKVTGLTKIRSLSLGGRLAALGIENGISHEGSASRPWRCVGFAWMHSLNSESNTLQLYVPRSLSAKLLNRVNRLTLVEGPLTCLLNINKPAARKTKAPKQKSVKKEITKKNVGAALRTSSRRKAVVGRPSF